MPRLVRQTLRGEIVERVRQHVHVAGGENHPRREGLDEHERAAVGTEHGDRPGDEGEADADQAGDEDGGDGDEL